MSGPVRHKSRAASRAFSSSPYSRSDTKKSSWSISGLLNYFNPLRSRYLSQEGSEAGIRDTSHAAAAETLSSRAPQISSASDATNHSSPAPLEFAQPPPSSASSLSPTNATFGGHDVSPETQQQGLEYLSKYLGERPRDEPLSTSEAEELISIIKKSTPADEHETFRFSSTPSTPQRGNSPLFASASTNSVPFSFSPSYVSAPTTPSSSPGKLLKQNPNGTYRWEGGGSSKPLRSRNRYYSPAFGPSPRPSPGRFVLRESPEKAIEPIRTDTKRRRVGEEASSSSPTPSGGSAPVRSAAPAPSPTRAAEALRFPTTTPTRPSSQSAPDGLKAPQPNGVKPSAPHLRVPVKPTTPVVPSPLRQTWKQSPSPSSRSSDDGSPTTSQRATKAASYLSEMIKEVTPVRNLDVSNPYQAASPVKYATSGMKAKPKPARRTRASGRPSAPPETITVNGKVENAKEKEKEKEEKEKEVAEKYTAQAIIEASVPKGSKRSRAPANIGKGLPNGLSALRSPSPPKASRSSFYAPQIEEVEDEDNEEKSRQHKKSKGFGFESAAPDLNGRNKRASVPAPIIEEIIDDDMSGETSTTKPTEVIEVDSKAGNEFGGNKGLKFNPGPSTGSPFSSSTSTRSPFGASGSGQKASAIPKEPSKLRFSYKPESIASSEASSSTTPDITASAARSTGSTTTNAHSAFSGFGTKKDAPTSAPPLSSGNAGTPSSFTVTPEAKSKADIDPKEHVRNLPVAALPVFTFDDAELVASGSGLPSDSRAVAAAKTVPVSELPQFDFDSTPVASTSSASPMAFNWSAAGMKRPDNNTSQWICSTCSLKNTDPAATKCSTCEAERTPVVSKAAPKTFDWAAAGLKKPDGDGAAQWTCSTCMLKNPSSEVSKCTFCDAPKPTSSSSPSSTNSAAPLTGVKAPVASFNWAAAGMKPPEPEPEVWHCSSCGLKNPETMTKCHICDASK